MRGSTNRCQARPASGFSHSRIMIVILAEKEQEEQISGHEGRRRKAGQKGEGEGMEGRRALGSGEVEAPCEIGPYVFLAKFPKMIGRFPPLV